MTYPAFDTSSGSSSGLSSRRIGTSFILLALFAGLLGGALALPVFQGPSAGGLSLCHGILMTFFVVCPAVLGGFGQWLLPAEIGAQKTVLPGMTLAGFGFLSAGVVLLPVMPLLALLAWACGVLAVAVDVIVTVLEGRSRLFRELSPLVWSLLATACGVVVVAPVLAAVITRMMVSDVSVGGVQGLVAVLHLPEAALMLAPSLGVACHLLVSGRERAGLTRRVAPYVFGVMAVLGPVIWMDGLFGHVTVGWGRVLVVLTQFVPSVLLVTMLCVDVWRKRQDLEGTTLWAFGSIVLLSAGWISDVLPGASDHSAAAFGGVMAVCGGFYAWVMRVLPDHIPAPLSLMHAGLTFIGALCSLTLVLRVVGEGMMGLSLATFGILGVFVLRETQQMRSRAMMRAGQGA